MTKIEEAMEKLDGKPCLFCHNTRLLCKGAGECDYNGSTCNETDNCGEYLPAECPHCRDGSIADLITPAPIPGLDPAVQAALIEFYMGGKPVEGWAWDGYSESARRETAIGFDIEGGTYQYVCFEGRFAYFSLTDPREES